MSVLPQSWTEVAIGHVFDIATGNTPPKAEANLFGGGIPFVKPGDLDKPGYIVSTEDSLSEEGLGRSRYLPKDTVLVSCIGNLGKVGILGLPGSCNQQINAILPSALSDPRFVFYWSLTLKEWLEARSSATTIAIINKRRFSEAPIPLPPLAEQRRIVAKLDSLTARTTRARSELDHIPRLVEKYKQAILAKAFSGDLTKEWRLQNSVGTETRVFEELPRELNTSQLPATWSVDEISQIAHNLDGRRVPIKSADRANRRGQYPYYGASGIIDSFDDFLFEGEHLLIGEDGANLLSRSTPIAFLATGKFWVNNHAHVLSARSVTSNIWLSWYINMIDLAPYVTGSAQPKLTQANLNRIKVPLPSMAEQSEIVRRIKTAFDWLDKVVAEHTRASHLVPKLDQSILAKAFRGELVPQDPNDEPASVLLERIKATSGEPKTTRGGRGKRKGS